MKVLVAGGHGQLGRSVVERGAARDHTVVAVDIDQVDICDRKQVDATLAAHAPGLVINAAAYTAVDKAEVERDRAFAVNAEGAAIVAQTCARDGIPLIHVSTDYVFDGTATRPYREDDALAPLCVYGASKAAGELAVLAAGGTVVRTSWLFAHGGPSFVHTMLRLANERSVLRVVADQHGCPTWACDLADALFALSELPVRAPIYHACGTGPTTWHGFAVAIVEEARRYAALACERVEPITTAEYPTPARRPPYSVLDTSLLQAAGIAMPAWRVGLARVIASELGAR
jgi:dTDP-4-dehydrorhamnose reductase